MTDLLKKLHSETAKIPWVELQTFFAKGLVLQLDASLDLPAIAFDFANDNSESIQKLLDSKQIAEPSVEQVQNWLSNGASVWSVVVAPFVLVQNIQ